MALEIQRLNVRKVIAGAQADFAAGSLQVCTEELARTLSAADERVRQVNVDLASAGDSTRIVCVKDVVEPRLRISGGGPDAGAIRVLSGAAVVTCGPIVGYQEGIIDMSGPGAGYTPFSDKQLVVLNIEVVDGLSQHEHEETVRQAGLRAAEYLAGAGSKVRPDETESVDWSDAPLDDQLPRIAYVYMVLSQGLLHDTYVLGENARQGLPRLVDPRIGMIGEIVSGNCVSACDKNTTYFHQNNPVIAELLRGHGRQWNLAGMVVTNDEAYAQKIRMLRDWGQTQKYHHDYKGFNYRMEGIQGAILRVKLRHLDAWTEARRQHAAHYNELLTGSGVQTPGEVGDVRHVYHVYAVRLAQRDAVQEALQARQIQTGIHYPIPVHLQKAYRDFGYTEGDFPVTERAARELLSLPMFAELKRQQVAEVCDAVRAEYARAA